MSDVNDQQRRDLAAGMFLRARWPLIVGLVLVLIAVFMEHLRDRLAHANGEPLELSAIFDLSLALHILLELGFAFLIAFVVAWAVEAKASEEHLKELNRVRMKIETDVAAHLDEISRAQTDELKRVFVGAFGAKHDSSYVEAALLSCFDHRLIRENYYITYRLDPFSEDDAKTAGVNAADYVYLTATISYYVKNIGVRPEPTAITYGFSVINSALERFAKVIDLHADRAYTTEELDAMASFDEEESEKDYAIDVELDPGQGIPVRITAKFVKEASDNDAFSFRYPTLNARCRIDSYIPHLQIGATARTASEMTEEPGVKDGRSQEWVIKGSILPHNSVVFWWRPKRSMNDAEKPA